MNAPARFTIADALTRPIFEREARERAEKKAREPRTFDVVRDYRFPADDGYGVICEQNGCFENDEAFPTEARAWKFLEQLEAEQAKR